MDQKFLALLVSVDVDYITPAQMALSERKTADRGVSVLELMENAGIRVAEVIGKKLGPLKAKRVLVVCGLGNNGGDGFVAARYLQAKGAKVITLLIGSPDQIKTEEARKNWNSLTTVKLHLDDPKEIKKFPAFEMCELLVVGLLGTGLKGPLREPLKTAIEKVNSTKAFKVAIDIPSGLDPLTGHVNPVAVKADLTVALHKAKVGTRNAKIYTGEIVVVPIGILE